MAKDASELDYINIVQCSQYLCRPQAGGYRGQVMFRPDAAGKRVDSRSRRYDDGIVGCDQFCGFCSDKHFLRRHQFLFLDHRAVVDVRVGLYGVAVAAVQTALLFKFAEVLSYCDRRDLEHFRKFRHLNTLVLHQVADDYFMSFFFCHVSIYLYLQR